MRKGQTSDGPQPNSVRAFADELDDEGVVSRDLRTLATIDVIEYVEGGCTNASRLKHDHVAVEPVVCFGRDRRHTDAGGVTVEGH